MKRMFRSKCRFGCLFCCEKVFDKKNSRSVHSEKSKNYEIFVTQRVDL